MKQTAYSPDARGRVFRIQRFCLHDGHGIRTTVFLSGCPLRCAWCHNPEGWEGANSTEMSVQTVMQTVLRDGDYYQFSGGGMTLSGGEPSTQPAFSLALAQAAREAQISLCMETAGTGEDDFYRQMALLGCTFLYDLKLMDPEQHRRFCGADNARILRHFALLARLGASVVPRMPLICGVNDTPDNVRATAAFLLQNGYKQLELMPYHNTAREKYARCGIRPGYDRENATPEQICAAQALFARAGVQTTVSGA